MRCVSIPECTRFTINEEGELVNTTTGHTLAPSTGSHGYLYHRLRADYPEHYADGAKHIYVHTALAKLFIPNPQGYHYVVHLNGNVADNRLANLTWSPMPNKTYHQAIELYKSNGGI